MISKLIKEIPVIKHTKSSMQLNYSIIVTWRRWFVFFSYPNQFIKKLKLKETCSIIKNQQRLCHYYQYKYNAKIEDSVNKQIQAEQQAAQDYLSMAVIFLHPCVSRPGAGGYFMNMYEEELGHMQDFIQYQLLRGGTVCVKSLNTPPVITNLTLFEAFKRGLEMEKRVTSSLEKLVCVAESVKDYQAADYVTSRFLSEQMKSVNEMAHHVTKLSQLCDEHSIYHYDFKLTESHPYKYVSKTVK